MLLLVLWLLLLLLLVVVLELVVAETPGPLLLSFSIDGEMSSAGRLLMFAIYVEDVEYSKKVCYFVVVELLLVVDFGCRGRICHLQSCVDESEMVWCFVEW